MTIIIISLSFFINSSAASIDFFNFDNKKTTRSDIREKIKNTNKMSDQEILQDTRIANFIYEMRYSNFCINRGGYIISTHSGRSNFVYYCANGEHTHFNDYDYNLYVDKYKIPNKLNLKNKE